ncbi:unnamed protein product [Sphagnum troendelagicum]|uniref:Uncharacterized protein n=3 Tax=Sphagnum TaxID=13804 RepID=A0ABP0TP34_9BRYO
MASSTQVAMNATLRRLEDKVAVITGGAAGLGEATARLFVRNGARVVIVDIDDEAGERLVTELGDASARYVHCDVRKESDVAAAVTYAVSTFGKLDIYFSNAGIYPTSRTSMDNLDMDNFDAVMATNLRGTVLSLKYAAKAMIPAKQGVIICTASIAGMFGGMTAASYAISKAAIIAAVHCASAELSQHGIRVNTISPFSVATPLTLKSFRQEVIKKLNNRELAGSILTPESVADAALFLASSESAFMSGHNLVLDGGFSTRRGPAQYNL